MTGPCGVPLSSLRLTSLFEPIFLFLFKICSSWDWGESKNQRLRRICNWAEKGFPGGSEAKESSCNVADLGLIPGLGRFLGGEHGNPFQYSCLENPHGQRSLVDYSPWGHKESDTTEQQGTEQDLMGPSWDRPSPISSALAPLKVPKY